MEAGPLESAAGLKISPSSAALMSAIVPVKTTVASSVDETSNSSQEMKAKLSGEVRVNFKSDYFPMEKLASPGMIASIQGNATPFDPNTKSAGASAPATP